MAKLWTDQQEAAYRVTERPGGRWSGGVYLPLDTRKAPEPARPTLIQEVLRALRELRRG